MELCECSLTAGNYLLSYTNTNCGNTLLHDDIPGYDLPTIDFVQTAKDNDEDVSILEEDNPQIYADLNNVLIHMIDKQEAAIFKLKQDFNQNKEKILEYIKYEETGKSYWSCVLILQWHVISFLL